VRLEAGFVFLGVHAHSILKIVAFFVGMAFPEEFLKIIASSAASAAVSGSSAPAWGVWVLVVSVACAEVDPDPGVGDSRVDGGLQALLGGQKVPVARDRRLAN
jgi:hypothetical protein